MTMWLVELFAAHGLDLLLGSTALLGLGTLAMLMHQRPIHVQRMGELTLLGVMAWLVLAVVPMQRLDWEAAFRSNGTPVSPQLDAHLRQADAAPMPITDTPTARGASALEVTEPGAMGWLATDSAFVGGARSSVESRLPAGTVAPGHVSPEPAEFGARDAALEAIPTALPDTPGAVEPLGAAATLPGSMSTSLPWSKLGAALFLGGSVLAAGYLLLGFSRLRRILSRATPAPSWVRQLLATDAGETDLPRVLVSDQRCGPFCVGVLRPTIVLPLELVARRSSAVRHVLLHEVAHARQGDGRGQLLVALALPVLWFHPLYWWVRKRVRFAAELVADDQAAGIVPRGTYARELIGLAESGWPSSPSPLAAPTILRSPSEFSRRIEMLLKRTDRLSTHCSTTRSRVQALAACGLVALTTGFFGAPPLQAQDAQDARDYNRLMAERDQLQAQMQELRAVLSELRAQAAQVEQARASSLYQSNRQAERAATDASRQTAEMDSLRNQADMLRTLAEQQRADAADVRRVDVRDLAEYLKLGQSDAASSAEALERLGYTLSRQAAEQSRAAGSVAATEQYRLAEALARMSAYSPGVMGVSRGVSSGAGVSAGGRGQSTMDSTTLELITSAIDLDGDIRIAQLQLMQQEELVGTGVMTDAELMQSRVSLETLERKSKLMRSLLVSELRATEVELAEAAEQANSSGAGRARLMRLQSRLEILADTLDMPAAGKQGGAR